jgi:polar amino acid transport system ATP-binding protein
MTTTPSSTALLELRNVRMSFGDDLVLHDVSLAVPEHTVTVLIGASGSGKSTLLRCINQLEQIDDGLVLFDGVDIADPRVDADEIRQRIGIVFQAFNLFPHMTVLDNITLAMRRVHGVRRDDAERQARELLGRFALADKADQHPDRLSGGQQQRVAIVRALAVSPRLMLFDEVTSALDPVLVNEVLSVVRDLRADGMTMVIATHEMGFATQVADEVCYLSDGVIVERGPGERVIHDPQDPRTREFLTRVHEAGRL